MRRDRKKEISEKDWTYFYGDEGAWRNEDNTENTGQEPTVSTVVIYTTETIKGVGKYHSLKIRHVRGFHGKGFMPFVKSRYGGMVANGHVVYGTSKEEYKIAFSNGKDMLEQSDKEWEEELEKIKKTRPQVNK